MIRWVVVFRTLASMRMAARPPGRVRPGGRAGVPRRVSAGVLGYGGLDDRLDRLLPHIGQHAHDDLTAALDQAEDRWPVLLQRAGARGRPPAAAPAPPRPAGA